MAKSKKMRTYSRKGSLSGTRSTLPQKKEQTKTNTTQVVSPSRKIKKPTSSSKSGQPLKNTPSKVVQKPTTTEENKPAKAPTISKNTNDKTKDVEKEYHRNKVLKKQLVRVSRLRIVAAFMKRTAQKAQKLGSANSKKLAPDAKIEALKTVRSLLRKAQAQDLSRQIEEKKLAVFQRRYRGIPLDRTPEDERLD